MTANAVVSRNEEPSVRLRPVFLATGFTPQPLVQRGLATRSQNFVRNSPVPAMRDSTSVPIIGGQRRDGLLARPPSSEHPEI